MSRPRTHNTLDTTKPSKWALQAACGCVKSCSGSPTHPPSGGWGTPGGLHRCIAVGEGSITLSLPNEGGEPGRSQRRGTVWTQGGNTHPFEGGGSPPKRKSEDEEIPDRDRRTKGLWSKAPASVGSEGRGGACAGIGHRTGTTATMGIYGQSGQRSGRRGARDGEAAEGKI